MTAQRETATMQAIDAELLRLDVFLGRLNGSRYITDVRAAVERVTELWEAHRCEVLHLTPPPPPQRVPGIHNARSRQ